MQQESRIKKSLLNARVNIFFYVLTLILSFFSRKIFLNCLGADFIGLTGTLYNLLAYLNIVELGIGSAIGYVLYKPIFDQNSKKINEIISVMGYLYHWIGIIILVMGCTLACFLPLIFSNTIFDLGIIYFAYFSFLSSSLIGYFINYRQNLLAADQKNYVVTAYYQSATIIKTIIQIFTAYYTKNLYLWVAFELSFGVIYSFILNWKINKTYPWLKTNIKEGKNLYKEYPEVIKYTKQLFVHRIAPIVQYQTTPFFIYTFVSLKMVAFYGNYSIIVDKIIQAISQLLGSTGAAVGNLVAEGNHHKIISVFWEFLSIRYLICNIIIFAFFHLISPFITLWVGSEYILDHTIVIIIMFNIYIMIIRGVFDQFLYAFGLFYDIYASIIESTLTIILSICLGYYWKLEGVLLAPLISMYINAFLWKPFFLFRFGLSLPATFFWKNNIKHTIVLLISFIISSNLIQSLNYSPYESYINWTIYALIIVGLHTIIAFSLTFLSSFGLRSLIKRFIIYHY